MVLAERGQVLLHLTARGGEKWANDTRTREAFVGSDFSGDIAEIEAAMNSGESAGSGSAQDAQQNGFSLVIARVRGGYAVEAESNGGALEKSVTGAAASGFQRKMKERSQSGNILRFDDGFERVLCSELANKALVGVRLFSAQAVIEVKDENYHAKGRSKISERAQQRDRIRTSADGHTNPFAGVQQAMLTHVIF
jgi:hypothetical protein